MVAKLLDRFFLFIVSREMGIVLGAGVCLAMIPMLLEQLYFLRDGWATTPTHEQIADIEGVIDGLAGILVAGGVFLESRETLRNMALRQKEEESWLQITLNEIGHHNGMGMLLVGLFMEIGTALIGLPKRMIDTGGAEPAIFGICFLLSVGAFIIMVDFVKDYARTYFRGPPQPAATPTNDGSGT
jgi:hypothetical protein